MARSHPKQWDLYLESIDHSRSWRTQKGYDSLWKRMIDLYRGKHYNRQSETPRATANMAFSTVNVIGPSVAVNYPTISIMANKQGWADQATIAQAVINYQWRHYDFRDPIRRAVDDSLILGHGWSKTTWKFSELERPITDEERDLMIQDQIGQMDAAAQMMPELAGELPSDDDIANAVDDIVLETLEDRPVVSRISPFDIFVSPESTSSQDLRWICQRRIERVDEVKKNEAFARKARSQMKANLAMTDGSTHEHERKDELNYESEGLVTLWEFWDLTDGKFAVWAEGGDRWLAAPQEAPYDYGSPFEMLRNHDVPDQFYPMGELEAMEGLQHELNKTRSQMVSFREKFARKWLVKEEHITKEGLEALTSGRDNQLVKVASDIPFSEILEAVPTSPLPGDIWNFSEQCEQDINMVTGVGEFARGSQANIRKTATEAAMMQDAANARASDKLDHVEQFIANTARKVLQANQQFLSGTAVARITGSGKRTAWFPYEREDIQGEFDFEVEAGSTQPNNEAFRRQQAISMAQVMMPFVGVSVKPDALAKHLLKEGFNVKDVEAFMINPEEQAAMMAAASGEGPLPAPPGGSGLDAPQPDPLAGPTTDEVSEVPGVNQGQVTQLSNQMGIDFNGLT